MSENLPALKGIVQWMRQLICIHGPIEIGFDVGRVHSYDYCKRCGKVTMTYYYE